MTSTKGTSDEILATLRARCHRPNCKVKHRAKTEDTIKAIEALIDKEVNKARLKTASDIFNLAHEYASNDETMVGSGNLRDYHYYNAIAKIGEFDGR